MTIMVMATKSLDELRTLPPTENDRHFLSNVGENGIISSLGKATWFQA